MFFILTAYIILTANLLRSPSSEFLHLQQISGKKMYPNEMQRDATTWGPHFTVKELMDAVHIKTVDDTGTVLWATFQDQLDAFYAADPHHHLDLSIIMAHVKARIMGYTDVRSM